MHRIDPADLGDVLPAALGDDTPGYALALMQGDAAQVLCQGRASLEHGVAITQDTAFRIASVTKHFLALVTLILHDKGVLDLDGPLGAHVPDLTGVQADVTLRQALQNCSGIRDHLELALMCGGALDQPVSLAQSLDLIARQDAVNFPPGSDFLYSNANFLLVTLACEQASGQSLGALMKTHLFTPNGMHDTRYAPHHTDVVANMARGYVETEGGFDLAQFAAELTGEGAMISTLGDLIRWYRYIRADPDGLIARLSEPAVFSNGTTGHYGLGFFSRPFHGTPSRGHNGLWPGYRSDLVRFDDLDLGLICMVNVNTADPSALTRHLIKALVPDRLDLHRATPDPDLIGALVTGGAYLNADTLEFARVSERDGQLQIDIGGWIAAPDTVTPTRGQFATPSDYRAVDWGQADRGVLRLTKINGTDTVLQQLAQFDPPQPPQGFVGQFDCTTLPATLQISCTETGLTASLTGPFTARPAWTAKPLCRDVALLSDSSGPWPRQLILRMDGDGGAIRLQGGRAKNMRFMRTAP